MMVDEEQFPAPAMWQGLMLIGVVIWGVWLFSINPDENTTPCHVFLALWTVAASSLVAAMF